MATSNAFLDGPSTTKPRRPDQSDGGAWTMLFASEASIGTLGRGTVKCCPATRRRTTSSCTYESQAPTFSQKVMASVTLQAESQRASATTRTPAIRPAEIVRAWRNKLRLRAAE